MGATSPGLLSASMAMGAVSSASGAYAQSQAAKTQGDLSRTIYEANATLANEAAAEAIARGDRQANQVKIGAKRLIGAQRAQLAASGVDVNSGSALDVQADTAGMGAMDALTAKNNAWREAWGYKAQALDSASRGRFASLAADASSRSTILTGGLDALRYGTQAAYYYKKGA